MIRDHYRENLRATVGSSAVPYGYTVATWTTGAVLMHAEGGTPNVLGALLFMAGAVLGFAVIGTLAFGGMTRPYMPTPRETALWGSFHFPSVGLAIIAAWLATFLAQGQLLWLLGAFLSTTTYLLVLGVETTLAAVRE